MALTETSQHAVQTLEALRTQGDIWGYALIEGLAVSTWTQPCATKDVDFLRLAQWRKEAKRKA